MLSLTSALRHLPLMPCVILDSMRCASFALVFPAWQGLRPPVRVAAASAFNGEQPNDNLAHLLKIHDIRGGLSRKIFTMHIYAVLNIW